MRSLDQYGMTLEVIPNVLIVCKDRLVISNGCSGVTVLICRV